MAKRLMIAIFCLFLLVAGAEANENQIKVYKVLTTHTLAANTSWTSAPIDLSGIEGYFSLEVVATGAGTAKIEYLLSNYTNQDGAGVFVTPSTASDIVTAHTSGNELYSFVPEAANLLKIKCTETTTTDAIVLTLRLVIQ